MTPSIFVDASAWIAISNNKDKFHAVAVPMYQDIVAAQQLMTITNLVIAEAYVSIRNTGGLKPALKLLEVVRETSFIRKIYSDAALESQAETLLKQYSDQRFSFVDAVSFVVMQQFGIAEAFAFDHHYTTAGFRVLPTT